MNLDNKEKKQLLYVRDLAEYLYCPRKIYLKLYMKIREKTNHFMIKGKIKHEVNDMLNESEPEIVSGIFSDLSLEKVEELYSSRIKEFFNRAFKKSAGLTESFSINYEDLLSEIVEKFEPEIKNKAKIISKFIKEYKGRELWEKIEPKFLSEFRIVDFDLGLSGRVDRIEINKGIAIPIEIKTGRIEGDKGYNSDILQLTAYALMIEKKFNNEVKKGKIVYKNKQFDVEITNEMKEEVLVLMNKIKNMVFIPSILSNFAKCKNCGLREECMSFRE